MNYRRPDTPAAFTRRETLSLEKSERRSGPRGAFVGRNLKRSAPKGSTQSRTLQRRAKGGGAIALVALMMSTYLLPAYAASEEGATAGVLGQPAQPQSVRIPSNNATKAAAAADRDGFTVTKTVPPVAAYSRLDDTAYSRIDDTFTNKPNFPIQWPFLIGAPISSWFGYRDCEGCPTFHKGIDITPGLGTPIQAIADGVVTEVGTGGWDYGTYVLITHQVDGQVISSRYAHMIEGSSPLAVGDVVTAGTLVGQVGSTGNSTGPHLHFEILLDGLTVTDPYAWMKFKVGS